MFSVFVKSVSINEGLILSPLIPKMMAGIEAGAKIGKEAHEDTWSDWDGKPEASYEVKTNNNGVSAEVSVDPEGTWWEAINFGSTSPGTEGVFMTIGPYNAYSQPGSPHDGDGSKNYDGIISSRGDSTIEARDFIGYVFEEYGDKIIQAIMESFN